ncbi:glutathione synthase [Amphiplicatus metriothermophilus]|uniref:Glutathione synthetase n=1 Tax=Amphiplicatus metriothermophilus TaxID=1519374 RepID=A0A239PKX8_9PROT|nr:glutathione synthase [Amphiplicatus metriothermophilus]MBB5517697.1 glutathione synthase [Amphiplicatus metriothermophilus]SNT67969.1 glutathione synthase [Amphiplicatus metriothermophilus]
MRLKIAIQMDPIEGVNVDADTTFDLALEAHGRGHELWIYQPQALALRDGRVWTRARKVETLKRAQGEHVRLAAPETLDLHGVDVALIRQDPPFDMAYITAAQILERLQPDVLVLNDPRAIRDAPEKLFVTEFPDLTPPTLITRDVVAIREFRAEHGDVILKPLYGNGGAGVFRVAPEDGNFNALIELFEQAFAEPFIVQKYLPEVRGGDKRIILLDGEAVGAINRVPAAGETRSNLHAGGRAEPVEMTARDQEICDRIGPELSRRGLTLAGVDVIGEWLTEINVTSPTGVQEIRRFGGADISALFWDWVEGRREG